MRKPSFLNHVLAPFIERSLPFSAEKSTKKLHCRSARGAIQQSTVRRCVKQGRGKTEFIKANASFCNSERQWIVSH